MATEGSITGDYLAGRKRIPVPESRRKPTGFLTIKGAAENNLKKVTVKIPLGIMTCVTGVSGSGKSSLVNEILYKAAAKALNRARTIPYHSFLWHSFFESIRHGFPFLIFTSDNRFFFGKPYILSPFSTKRQGTSCSLLPKSHNFPVFERYHFR